jgi:hypothetical protein
MNGVGWVGWVLMVLVGKWEERLEWCVSGKGMEKRGEVGKCVLVGMEGEGEKGWGSGFLGDRERRWGQNGDFVMVLVVLPERILR